MPEEIIAVCHHRLLPVDEQPTAGWLTEQTLIHDGTPGRGLKINSTAALIQAAISGRGVALMRKALVVQELKAGRLVHLLLKCCWPVKWAYYMVASPKALRRYEVAAFHDWLVRRTLLDG